MSLDQDASRSAALTGHLDDTRRGTRQQAMSEQHSCCLLHGLSNCLRVVLSIVASTFSLGAVRSWHSNRGRKYMISGPTFGMPSGTQLLRQQTLSLPQKLSGMGDMLSGYALVTCKAGSVSGQIARQDLGQPRKLCPGQHNVQSLRDD